LMKRKRFPASPAEYQLPR